MLNKNISKLSRHDTLVRDTRPNPRIWARLDDTYWSAKISQLKHNKFELGENDAGIEFTATFRVEGNRIRATLTPHSNGHKYTHLTVWRWYALKPKLVGDDAVEPKDNAVFTA
jgi:hypothetical protein